MQHNPEFSTRFLVDPTFENFGISHQKNIIEKHHPSNT
jgi:hypothetical protein